MTSITIIIVVITCIISYVAFSNHKLYNDLIFYPPSISSNNQWYRFFTCGFIHADIGHLAFNMISLYLFGRNLEYYFAEIFATKGPILYIFLYISALGACLVPTYNKHKDDYGYRSLGASGAVSAVVFASIFLDPTNEIGFFIIPPIIPGFIFAPVYLFISAYMSKKGADNINHSAHIWGALYGIAFLIVTALVLSGFNPITHFVNEISGYLQ